MNITGPFFMSLITTFILYFAAKELYKSVTKSEGYMRKNSIF